MTWRGGCGRRWICTNVFVLQGGWEAWRRRASMSRSRIVAGLIGLVLLTAGALKAADPAAFAVVVRNYRLLPWTGDVLVALYLPWLEVVCGGALLLRAGYRGALWLAALLMAAFLAAYGSTRLRGLDVECGCFGAGFHRGSAALLLGDAAMLAALLWVLKTESAAANDLSRGG